MKRQYVVNALLTPRRNCLPGVDNPADTPTASGPHLAGNIVAQFPNSGRWS